MAISAIGMEAGASIAQKVSRKEGGIGSGCNWSQMVMLAGVALSVAGVAFAFFSSNTLAMYGFGALGIVSIIGVFVAQSALEAEQLETSISELNDQNAFLQAQAHRVHVTIRSVKNERDHLLAVKTVLEQNVKRVEGENVRLTEILKRLEESLKALATSNRGLNEQNVQLEKRISELKQTVASLEHFLEQFFQLKEQFSRKFTMFAQSTASLGVSEQHIAHLIETLEGIRQQGVASMQEHVALAKSLIDHLKGHLDGEKEGQRQAIIELRDHVGHIETSCSSVASARLSLEQTHAHLRDDYSSMSSVLESIELEKRRVEELSVALEASSQSIALERRAFCGEVEALKETKDDLERVFSTTLRAFEQKLSERDRQIISLKRRVEELQLSQREGRK